MLDRLETIINWILDAVGVLTGLLLIALVCVITYNVIGRYVFNSSSIALEELSWHFYASLFLLGISYAVRCSSHVRVDLIFDSRSPKTKAWIDIIGTLVLMIPFSLLVIYYGFDFAYQSYSFGPHAENFVGLVEQFLTTGIGEKSQDPGGLNNRFVIKGVIPLAFIFVLLSAVSVLINRFKILSAITEQKTVSAGEGS